MEKNNNQAGKGDSPRNCFSKKYRDNYDLITWKNKIKVNLNKPNEVDQSKKSS
jgi:hypothetical protein